MNTIYAFSFIFLGILSCQTNDSTDQSDKMNTIYHINMETLEGEPLALSSFKGKKLIIVNVASECGYTPQYKELQALYEQAAGKVAILGVPSNDFGGQEPGSAEEIRGFCTKNYGVTFPISEKVNIKKQPVHPLYQWLTQKKLNGVEDSEVEWNFQKYLINEDGELVTILGPGASVLGETVFSWLGI